ncbi:hypothetical protein Poly51_30910 [Rubripirellula tenax]|uniref:Uncharacterized protein n=1 Tax=Rubripirellula tenax TaxID=2528015 RepID=A0A5C6F1A8_9BACT|nr:hypothetical protein [Rubripirellula tenax]TWU54374.1 hypothetical protein Poly51_30910 [Rubripirellula tenax]
MNYELPTTIERLAENDRSLASAMAYHSLKPVTWRLRRNALFPSAKFALWPDGFCLWASSGTHENRDNFLSGTVDLGHFQRVVDTLDRDGFFNEPELSREVNGIDVPYETLSIKSDEKQLEMKSSSGFRRRPVHGTELSLFDAFSAASSRDLGYLYAWERGENALSQLRPHQGIAEHGSFVYFGLDLVWRPLYAPHNGG